MRQSLGPAPRVLYSPELLDHFQNPRLRGGLPDATGSGEARFQRCGDWMRLEVEVRDGRVADARFEAHGCGAALAAGSAGAEIIIGQPLDLARNLTAFDLDRALGGVPPAKRHALWMMLECLAAALGPRDQASS